MRSTLRAAGLVCATCLAIAASASAADAATRSVIVKYRAGITEKQRSGLLERAGVERTVGKVRGVDARVVRTRRSAGAVAASLNRSAHVLYAEPDRTLHALATPNDARFGEMYALNNTGQTGGSADADIDAPEGWDLGGLGSFPASGGTKVGIVDTGIDQNHEDLSGKTADCAGVKSFGLLGTIGTDPTIVAGKCVDDNDHGTHVAGTIAAKANNGVGVAGVSFDSPLSMCKALDSSGSGPTSGVANCIAYLHSRGARVISMSLGGGASTTMQSAVTAAYENGGAGGSLVVAAAGNDGDATLNYPAAYPEVVSVAATDARDQRASFSNANSDVEVAAPGVDILSTKRGGGYVEFSGTSMATPHASGVAAVIWQRNPSFTAAQVRTKLDQSVDDLGPAGRDPSFGFGRVNLSKAAG